MGSVHTDCLKCLITNKQAFFCEMASAMLKSVPSADRSVVSYD
jgi:hypothetical protein